ncbi:uncharacterized protein BYT42DRAFT_158208 [Radiomyces spectabilis]|uniref:uncharacterized protein n=1 Tax=Radiomyces spectabilis TaxID=64574 RepID=UPI00221EC52D|nr:uncharacterized protein BYT42DRAFT_158208 [Radiomyces spectabilis]KAI8365261.1 hypothetical protein BYT42DRAFT_158208 [Radiomyces spectabilis]
MHLIQNSQFIGCIISSRKKREPKKKKRRSGSHFPYCGVILDLRALDSDKRKKRNKEKEVPCQRWDNAAHFSVWIGKPRSFKTKKNSGFPVLQCWNKFHHLAPDLNENFLGLFVFSILLCVSLRVIRLIYLITKKKKKRAIGIDYQVGVVQY